MRQFFRIGGLALLGMIAFACVGCATVGLPRVSSTPADLTAAPDLLNLETGLSIETAAQWEAIGRPANLEALEAALYGPMPPESQVTVVSRKDITPPDIAPAGRLEEVILEIDMAETPKRLTLHILSPAGEGPYPAILTAGFCPNHAVFKSAGITPPDVPYFGFCDDSWRTPVAQFVFGRYINAPPINEVIVHGYAYIAWYPGEVVPDSAPEAFVAMQDLPADNRENGYRAIASWAWLAHRVVDFAVTDPRFDPDALVLMGHSRHGKSALLAAATDARVAGVISHQSGTGGASLTRDGTGESIGAVTSSYPHWFNDTFASYAGRESEIPVDQHALLALLAPRPMLLGNSARDQWSDPQGSFAAAKAASPVYRLYGSHGLQQDTLAGFVPDADIAFHMREGTHGITPEDWTAFFAFMEAHFGPVQAR